MPNLTNEASPKLTFRRGFKKLADDLAVEYRSKLGIKDCEPLSAVLLAEHLNLQICTPSDFSMTSERLQELISGNGASRWSAITIGRGKPEMIIHNDSHAPCRVESNIMHELAHVLLEHEMCEIDMSIGIPLRKYDQEQEDEAEWFGGCLHLPKPALVKHYVYKGLTKSEIATKFNASLQMVNYRIGKAGIEILKNRIGNKRKW